MAIAINTTTDRVRPQSQRMSRTAPAALPGKRSASSKPRRLRNFGGKSLLALVVAVAMGAYSAAFAYAVVSSSANPGASLLVRPLVAPATTRLADLTILTSNQKAIKELEGAIMSGALSPELAAQAAVRLNPADRDRVRNLARSALQASPLSSPALRQLAYLESEQARKIELLELAEAVEKRDVSTNLQLAEMRLRNNDLRAALTGFDRSLTVSSRADAVVFPLLVNGMNTDPTIRSQVGALVAGGDDWVERMVRWGIDNPTSLPALSLVLDRLPARSEARALGFGQQMVDLLANQNAWEAAFRVYAVYSQRPQDPSDLTRGSLAPLDWRLIDDFDAGSRPFGDGIEIFANAARQGALAEIVTRLAPGPHQLSITLDQASGQGAMLGFRIDCLAARGGAGSSDTRKPLKDGLAVFAFEVPRSGCVYQRLSLELMAESEQAGAVVTRASLSRAGAASAQ